MCKKLSIILLCLLMITGCSKDKPILYSNLGNQASQNKLTNILNEADLPKDNSFPMLIPLISTLHP